MIFKKKLIKLEDFIKSCHEIIEGKYNLSKFIDHPLYIGMVEKPLACKSIFPP